VSDTIVPGASDVPARGASCSGAANKAAGAAGRKPAWLRVRVPAAAPFRATAGLLDELALHTVCDSARCPNRGECFASGTATFLILGDACTRACGFCAIGRSPSHPAATDADEPLRVAAAAHRLGLAHVVVTSVTRDDLPDAGAGQYAATVRAIREALAAAGIEVLVPDFRGAPDALGLVLSARPDVLAHNLETVPRLYGEVRPGADYARSLALLAAAARRKGSDAGGPTLVKTGFMLGLGETTGEVKSVLADCAAAGVDVVTVGQYLRPHDGCLPVARYVPPDEFAALAASGERLGLRIVAGPLVRSSYHAAETFAACG
jgi:lipoyl synthase